MAAIDWNDRNSVLAAVRENGNALQFASEDLQNDRRVVLDAVGRNGEALQYAPNFQDDSDAIFAAVRQNGLALAYASEFAQGEIDIVLDAVGQNGNALEFASVNLKDNRVVVLAAVVQSGEALRHASDNARLNIDAILASSPIRLVQKVKLNLTQHELAMKYNSRRQFWLITGLIVLALLGAILTVVAAPSYWDENGKAIIAAIILAASGLGVFLFKINDLLAYKRAVADHHKTARSLQNLLDNLLNTSYTRDTFITNNPILDEFLNGCGSIVPTALSDAFTELHRQLMAATNEPHVPIQHYIDACDNLSERLSKSCFFPMYLPNYMELVNATMRHLQDPAGENAPLIRNPPV